MALGVLQRVVELATVHPNDRAANRIAMIGELEPANTELTRPKTLGLPSLSELGTDLLGATRRDRWIVIGRPFALGLVYIVLFQLGWWIVSLALIPYIYLTAGAAMHDVIHKTLGVSKRWHGVTLFAIGSIVLESGHTLRETHQVHHRKLHTSIDPEGYVDNYSSLRTLGEGPFYKHYLACWVLRNRPNSRAWVVAEALWAQCSIILGLILGWKLPVFGVYIAATVLGSWIFPYVGVKLVHSDPGNNVLKGTRTMRGKLVSLLGCGLTFHLEHHLYPRVPGHKLRHLAKRLDGRLVALGVEPTQMV